MVPKKEKVITHWSLSTPKHIALLSPGINDSSPLTQHAISSMIVAPENIPPYKTWLTMISNILKDDRGWSD